MRSLKAFSRSSRSQLRILSYRWHVPHQYEIYKLPIAFTLARGFLGHMSESWAYKQRALPDNVSFLDKSNINFKDYDLCILHFDENVLCPELSNRVLASNWGEPFQWLLAAEGLPKIGICHGTPPFVGQYALNERRIDNFEIHRSERNKLVSVLATAGCVVVCNSWQAKEEWGFKNCRVIWHGFDPSQFKEGAHRKGVLTIPHDLIRPHYRGTFEQMDVEHMLDPKIAISRGVKLPKRRFQWPRFDMKNAHARRRFRWYVDAIGDHKIYLNTTRRSPMPRSRGEAMMTGVAPVSLRNHDVDMFVENSVDGFYSDSPAELADFINWLMLNENAYLRICRAARAKAIAVFHNSRFLNDWQQLLIEVLGSKFKKTLSTVESA